MMSSTSKDTLDELLYQKLKKDFISNVHPKQLLPYLHLSHLDDERVAEVQDKDGRLEAAHFLLKKLKTSHKDWASVLPEALRHPDVGLAFLAETIEEEKRILKSAQNSASEGGKGEVDKEAGLEDWRRDDKPKTESVATQEEGEELMEDIQIGEDEKSEIGVKQEEMETEEDEDESDEEEEEEEESNCSSKLITISEFKKDTSQQNITIRCTVKSRGEMKTVSGEKQFLAEVADESSSVDCCVRNEKLFSLFEVGAGLILRKTKWSGKVLFVNEAERTKTAPAVHVPEGVMEESFGTGDPISISEAQKLEVNSWFSVRGKIVKASDITRRLKYDDKKILTHRQVKLKDETNAMEINLWEQGAVKVKLGDVVKITACKRLERDDGPEMTTTRKSNIKILDSSLYPVIRKDSLFQSGTLMSINVDTFQACTSPQCYKFSLTDKGDKMNCKSCNSDFAKQGHDYAEAQIDVLSRKGNVISLVVFWPQLKELFGLFGKDIDIQDGSKKIKAMFHELAEKKKAVNYHACRNVTAFKLPKLKSKTK